MTESHHRRTYLVDRGFQLKYILLLAGWGLVLGGLFGLWAWQAHQQVVETMVRDAAHRAALAHAERPLLSVLPAIGVLSALALGLVGFIMTHRVAGPVYVMSHLVTELAMGRYPPRRALRRHDELKTLHGQFLQAVERMKERDRRQLERLEDAVQRMRAALARAPELGPAVTALEAEARERREALALAERTAATPVPARVATENGTAG
jgi:hypothetical protein